MTKNLKLLSLILCLVMLVSLLAACGTPAVPKTDASAYSQAQTTAAAPAGPTEISYMLWGDETEQATTQKVLDTFNQKDSSIKVKAIAVPYDQYVTKLNTLAASNTLPDTAMMMEAETLKWADNGKLLDQSDMYTGDDAKLAALGFKGKDGKIVAYSSADEVLVTYYNKPLFDAAHVAYPPASADQAWTWAQFVDAAKKLTKDKNGKTPNDSGFDKNNIVQYGTEVQNTVWMWPVFCLSNGGGLCSEDGKQLLLNKPESEEAVQDMADLYLKDNVAPSPAAQKTLPTIDAALLSGKVAMVMDGQWNIGTAFGAALDKGLKYGVGVLPKFKRAVTFGTGGPLVIFNTTKSPDAAKTFIKWFGSEDNNMDLITSGIWMPTSEKWYKDDDLIKKWTDNKNHVPLMPEYKTAVIDYAMTSQAQVPWYYLSCYSKIQDVLTGAMDPIWAGTKTAKDAIEQDIMPKIQPIFDGN